MGLSLRSLRLCERYEKAELFGATCGDNLNSGHKQEFLAEAQRSQRGKAATKLSPKVAKAQRSAKPKPQNGEAARVEKIRK
jgi:hypothetical protein